MQSFNLEKINDGIISRTSSIHIDNLQDHENYKGGTINDFSTRFKNPSQWTGIVLDSSNKRKSSNSIGRFSVLEVKTNREILKNVTFGDD